jgi:hypothetical protein
MDKKALIIGINYTGTSSELNGCINDANNIRKELEKRGYLESNITFLTDNTEIKPTRNNILMKLLELILSGSKELFFHYSGHGCYIKDTNGDEEDGKDECLVPIDYLKSGMVIDDEIRGILCSLSENQNLTCILDCCHSGSGIDLAYNLYERNNGEYLSMKKDSKLVSTRGKCIMLSGSKDSETSADAFIGGNYQGAMTYSFLEALKEKVNSYEDLIRSIRKTLKDGGYSQNAQLSSGQRLNIRSQFTF